MKRITQEAGNVASWIQSTDIQLNGVVIASTESWGSGILSSASHNEDATVLLTVPSHLVLSLSTVWDYASTDLHLRQLLEAQGEWTRTARGAILTFLLFQIAATSPDILTKIGVENLWTSYLQFLPKETNMPTFWSEAEQELAQGSSLGSPLTQKLSSLRREFDSLIQACRGIDWCKQYWLDPNPETGASYLTFDDWLLVDAMYRSRAMELPSHGLCMVPVADMANHAMNTSVTARTFVHPETHDVQLVLDQDRTLSRDDQVTITYGEEKGACEMLFSYGFIDQHMDVAETCFLEMHPPEDDPLWMAKRHCFQCPPGVRIYYGLGTDMKGSRNLHWTGGFVWCMCVNEEDGLEIRLEDVVDGNDRRKGENGGSEQGEDYGEGKQQNGDLGKAKRAVARWKGGDELRDVIDLEKALSADDMRDVYQLRAYTLVSQRIGEERERRAKLRHDFNHRRLDTDKDADGVDEAVDKAGGPVDEDSYAWKVTERLKRLEGMMLTQAHSQFDDNVSATTPVPLD